MADTEIKRELLKTINQISLTMKDLIFNECFDKYGPEQKYCFAMFNEAFQTFDVFCYAMQHIALGQAGLLLRQVLEQTAIAFILVQHPETLSKFVEHYKLRKEWVNFKKGEQIKKISERFNVPNNPTALAYLDYGWIGFDDLKKCTEDEMLRYAGFEDILSWRKVYLDKLAHTSFTTIDLAGESYDFPIMNNFIEIACKVFDYLCCAFHNLTKFDFIFDDEKLFNKFRELYSSYKN